MNITATVTHFTACLVNDTSCLDQDCMDITVLQDELISGGADNERDWATDAVASVVFYAVTTVDAKDGDVDDAMTEARHLLEQAGWRIVGDWDAVDVAYIVTVERVQADQGEEQGESGDTADRAVYWSVMCGESPGSHAVQPEPAGVTVPDDVLQWAAGYGLSVDDPDVYLLVCPKGDAEDMNGEIAYMAGQVSPEDAAAIRTAMDAERATQ